MKLTHIRIKDFRSFSGEHDFDVLSGVNYFVGPNNCGKSNVIRALELALDPAAQYIPELDRPASSAGAGKPPTTRITLSFHVGATPSERTLLRRAQEYELALRRKRGAATTGKIHTYAAEREVRLVTSFAGGGARQISFQAKGFGAASLPSDSVEHAKMENQFRATVRFGVVHSGEDLETLLRGKFRDILHLVIKDHLGEALESAHAARDMYRSALQVELLEPLRSLIEDRVGALFPEISLAELVPAIPTVEETLSSVDVRLGDAVTTQLADKGTGVRGAVLVSMLQYLAEQSKRSLVLAVEEPEAFLHPGAQEAVREQLEDLAGRSDVTLLVTTHSPYVISRSSQAQVLELRKDLAGDSSLSGAVCGSETRATLLGGLYRDAGMAYVLERSLEIPTDSVLVVVTEGYTDGLFIRLCCDAAGRSDLLEGMHFIAAGRAANVVPQALLAEAATVKPVVALLDHDANGRAAIEKLKSFNWEPNKRILRLSDWPEACGKHDVEIEDLLPVDAVASLLKTMREDEAIDGKVKCGSTWHLQFSKAWKDKAIEDLAKNLNTDSGGMIWLAEELRSRATKIMASRSAASAIAPQP